MSDSDEDTIIISDLTLNNHYPMNYIDYIDLTKDSPINKLTRLHKRCDENVTTNISESINLNTNNKYKKDTINIGKSQNSEVSTNKLTTCNDVGNDEIIILDDTGCISEDDIHYASKTDSEDCLRLKCPICLELLCSKLKPTTTCCGHIFCFECLKNVAHQFKKCPTCKATISLKTCTRLFL